MTRIVGVLTFALIVGISVLSEPAFAKRLVPVISDPSGTGLEITVRSETAILAEAQVWVESLGGKLIASGRTNVEGLFIADITEAELAQGVSITAHAPGHSAVSFLENVAHRVDLELTALPLDTYAILNGRLNGFKDNDDDDKAMIGLVAKAFEVTDLIQLDPGSFISPLKDSIDVFGKREIPSNLVLPDQTFPIYFIPIRVNKPNYRLPALTGSSSRYFGVSGTVDVRDAISAIRNDDTWAMVNLLEFNKVGVTDKIEAPKGNRQTLKVDVNSNVAIRETLRLKPPRRAASGAQTKRLAIALWEPLPGTFVPTDVKQVEDKELRLTTVANKTAKVLDVLVTEDGSHFRGAWVKNTATVIPEAALTAGVDIGSIDSTWMIRGGESASLIVAHVETKKKTSVGSVRFEDHWVVVGPRKAQLRIPPVALRDLRDQLGTISHVSVDLLQMTQGSYPFINGENIPTELSVLEKVRKQVSRVF